jgi:hypothetical protein
MQRWRAVTAVPTDGIAVPFSDSAGALLVRPILTPECLGGVRDYGGKAYEGRNPCGR